LQVGFLPVSDCAPLVQAQESGLFAKYDLEVELQRQSSWVALRDRVVDGALDAAHAPATLPFLTNLGLESEPCECIAGMVLSLQGSAITISRTLWDQGVRSAETLREQIYRSWGKRTYTFGVVFPFSTQYFLLREWLKSGGIVPNVEVRMVVVPPAQMFPTLKLGYIDGYCVEEPWTSVAVQAGVGMCVATSAELAPLHPEKVLMVRQSFAHGRHEEHERLLAALLEACSFCDQPQNRPLLSELLAQPHYVNAPVECLEAGFAGPFESAGHRTENPLNLTLFHRHQANEPTDEKAAWIISHLYEFMEQSSLLRQPQARTPVLANVFRRDVFERAKSLVFDHAKRTGPEAEPCETHARPGA
jgi:ABC-type nitrate/sulfonate/bicarbonate transport system substrate-binding protein